MEDNRPEETDSGLDEIFEETQEPNQEGTEDVEKKSDQLSLEKLSALAGRKDNPFKSYEEYQKHYEGLKSLSGDQEAIKERKAQKELEKKAQEEATAKDEIAQLKKELARKDFLVETQTSKDIIDVIEAYADKNEMTLAEAWNSDKFKSIREASQRASKKITTNNRITPVQAQTVTKLAEEVKATGSDDAKIKLVSEYLK